MRTPIKHSTSFRQFTKMGGRALIAICIVSPVFSTGCRSGKSPMNLFGSRAEPSAETLAGSGPTTTYPAPPSSRVTPQSIASIAGGTAPSAPATPTTPSMSVPGLPPAGANPYALTGNKTAPPAYAMPGSNSPVSTTPGMGSPVPQTPNYAAAGANGYAMPGSQGNAAPQPTTNRPSGYNLAGVSTSNQTPPAPTNVASVQSKPTSSFEMPPLNSLTPTRTAASSASTPTNSSNNYASGGGFTLPSGMVPSANTVSATSNAPTTAVASLNLPPSNSQPSNPQPSPGLSTPLPSSPSPAAAYQTAASAKADASGSARPSTLGGASSQENAVRPTGYTPGSTGAASGYPGAATITR